MTELFAKEYLARLSKFLFSFYEVSKLTHDEYLFVSLTNIALILKKFTTICGNFASGSKFLDLFDPLLNTISRQLDISVRQSEEFTFVINAFQLYKTLVEDQSIDFVLNLNLADEAKRLLIVQYTGLFEYEGHKAPTNFLVLLSRISSAMETILKSFLGKYILTQVTSVPHQKQLHSLEKESVLNPAVSRMIYFGILIRKYLEEENSLSTLNIDFHSKALFHSSQKLPQREKNLYLLYNLLFAIKELSTGLAVEDYRDLIDSATLKAGKSIETIDELKNSVAVLAQEEKHLFEGDKQMTGEDYSAKMKEVTKDFEHQEIVSFIIELVTVKQND